jgi:protein-disulfide isomerase
LRSDKLTLITAGVGLLVIAALAVWQLRPVEVPDALGDPSILYGNADASHQLVAFVSPTCSYCARFELTTGHTLYGKKDLLYAVYPIALDETAEAYIKGFFCAAEGGAFGSYAVLHYQNYFVTKNATLSELAERAGLEPEAFRRCAKAPRTTQRAKQAQAWAEALGVDRTPTFYLRGPGETSWREVRGTRGEEFWRRWLQGE